MWLCFFCSRVLVHRQRRVQLYLCKAFTQYLCVGEQLEKTPLEQTLQEESLNSPRFYFSSSTFFCFVQRWDFFFFFKEQFKPVRAFRESPHNIYQMCFSAPQPSLHQQPALRFPWGGQARPASMHNARAVLSNRLPKFPHSPLSTAPPPGGFVEKTGHSVDPSLWTNPQRRRGESVRPAAPLRLPPPPPHAVFYCNNDLWMKARPPSVAAAPSSDPGPVLRRRREVIFLTLIQLLGKKDPQPNLSLNLKEIATEGGVGGRGGTPAGMFDSYLSKWWSGGGGWPPVKQNWGLSGFFFFLYKEISSGNFSPGSFLRRLHSRNTENFRCTFTLTRTTWHGWLWEANKRKRKSQHTNLGPTLWSWPCTVHTPKQVTPSVTGQRQDFLSHRILSVSTFLPPTRWHFFFFSLARLAPSVVG